VDENNSETSGKPMIVVDLDKKQKKRNINRLRKGRGKLMSKVDELIADLREAGSIDAHAQPVVIVVRQKDRHAGGRVKRMFPKL
jgi:hypothetical protein